MRGDEPKPPEGKFVPLDLHALALRARAARAALASLLVRPSHGKQTRHIADAKRKARRCMARASRRANRAA